MTTPSTGADPVPAVPVRPKSSFAGDVLKLVTGTAFAQLLSILASPFLTRLYAPEDFGVSALFISITSILGVIVCLRYELSIMLAESDEEAANLLGVSLLSTTLISLLLVPIVWWGRAPLLRWLNAPDLAPFLWLVPLMVFSSGVFLALNYWNSRTKHFGRLSIAKVSSSLMTTSTQLSLGFAGFATGASLISATLGGSAIATTVLAGQIWRDDGALFLRSFDWRRMVSGVKRYRKFPLIDIWGALLNSVSWQLPTLLFAIFFSQIAVGFYAFAFRILYLPMALIGTSLGQVYFQRASELKSDPSQLAETTEMLFQRLIALCLLPALLLSLVGGEVFSVVFGEKWIEAGVYAQILSVWMFFWFVSSPLSTIFVVLERQGLLLMVQIFILSTRAASLFVGGMMGDVYLALWLFAISGAIVYGGLAFWNLLLAGVRLKTILAILMRHFLYIIPALGVLLLLKVFQVPALWLTWVSAIELVLYYAIIAYKDPKSHQFIKRKGLDRFIGGRA